MNQDEVSRSLTAARRNVLAAWAACVAYVVSHRDDDPTARSLAEVVAEAETAMQAEHVAARAFLAEEADLAVDG